MPLPSDSPSFTIALEQAVRNWLQSKPSLSGRFVESEATVVVGDFGQDATNENFSAYTFLFLPAEQLPPWQERIRLFRESEYREGGNFEFKAVSKDRLRQRLLPVFLNICGTLHGFTLTLLVPKCVRWAFPTEISPKGVPGKILEDAFGLKLAPHIAEKTLRVVHGILGGLCALPKVGNPLALYLDRDAMMNEPVKIAQLLERLISRSLAKQVRQIILARDEGAKGKLSSDLLSVPDLVCGAVTEIHNRSSGSPHMPSPKTAEILSWMHDEKQTMQHCVLTLKPQMIDGIQHLSWPRFQYRPALPPGQQFACSPQGE